MRRVAMLLVVVVVTGLVVWLGLTALQEPTPSEGEAGAMRDGPEEETQASLVGHPVETPEVVPERVQGPGIIQGMVYSAQRGVPVRVEVRPLRSGAGHYGAMLVPPYSEGPPVVVMEVVTGEQFEISDLPLGSYEISAQAPGLGTARARVYCRSSQPSGFAHLWLQGGEASLVGRAVLADGRPFAGIVFAMSSPSGGRGGELPSVAIDPEGRFALEALPAGEVAVVFIQPGVLRSTFASIPVPQLTERVFVVDGDLLAVEGRVIADDTEEPLSGARIEVDCRTWALGRRVVTKVESGPDGTFVLRLPAKAGRLVCFADGFEPLMNYSLDEEKDMILRLKRRGIVTGIVVSKESDTPLEGVAVRGWNWHTFGMADPLATSDAEGRFCCEAGPGKGMIYALDRDWVSHNFGDVSTGDVNPSYVAVGQGETKEVRLEVVRAARVDGVVRTASGEPIANASIFLAPVNRRTFTTFIHSELFSATTDSDGRYELKPVLPGRAFTVHARPPRGLQATSEPFTLAAGEHRTVDLQIEDPRSLQVRVVNGQTGKAVRDARIAGYQGRHPASAVTDAEGRAALTPLHAQPVSLEVKHPDYMTLGGRVPARRGGGRVIPVEAFEQDEVVLELTPGFKVSGKILNADGSSYLGGGGIGIHPVGELPGAGLGLVGRQMHKEAVEFVLGPVPAGTYDLILIKGHREPDLIGRWTVEAGQKDLQLRIDPEAAEAAKENVVTFRVHGAGGKPANGWIRITTHDGLLDEFGSVYKGEYRVRRIRANTRVWINIWERQGPGAEEFGSLLRGPLVLAPGVVELTLEPPVTLEGRLLDPQGRGVHGSVITAEPVYPPEAPQPSPHSYLPSVRTDEDGGFEVPYLMDGDYRLVVGTPTEYALAGPVVARPGTDVEIRLVEGLGVELVVLGPDAEPIAGASVEVTLGGRDKIKRQAATDAKGKARIEGLAADVAYSLIVKPPVAGPDLVDHRIDAWFPADLEVALRPGRALDVEVRRGSTSVPHARVWWRVGEEPWREERAAAGGSLRLLVPVAEPVELRADDMQLPDVSRASPPVVAAPETGRVVLELE